jgi:hypothetical protein
MVLVVMLPNALDVFQMNIKMNTSPKKSIESTWQWHELKIFKVTNIGELTSIAKWKFKVFPDIECVSVIDEFPDGNTISYLASQSELNSATKALKLYFFKQKPSPLAHSEVVFWSIPNKFNEDEKQHIRKLSIFNNL